MSDLLVIEFPSEEKAEGVREMLLAMQKENLIEFGDTVLMASVAFPAWCLGHDPSAQILCVSYAQDLANKLARDCRGRYRPASQV